ncbi:MAG: sodium:solute symporter family protein [Candidatus Micrarchaeia archaeon]
MLLVGIIVFLAVFLFFVLLGFLGSKWRKGNLTKLFEWSQTGGVLGPYLVWFLIGADLFTAYTFLALPSLEYAAGSLAFYAVPYASMGFLLGILTMPRLWRIARKRGYVTAADFVQDRYSSKSLSIAIALTGIVATLPYIALQVLGMEVVLETMLLGAAGIALLTKISLVLAFLVLLGFVFISGMRGITLTAVLKDFIVLSSVAIIIVVVLASYGGFHSAFSALAAQKGKAVSNYFDLPKELIPAFLSMFIGSSFALYLYPHAINGALSAKSGKALRKSMSLLPIYGIGLALLTLFGILIFAVPKALAIVKSAANGLLTMPAIALETLPPSVVGFVFVGIFIGGLVPAAIMAIASANLLTKNVVMPFKKLSQEGQTKLAKWLTAAIIFIALGFVFVVNPTYAIQLQLLGGIIITQTLPAVFLGLYSRKLDWKALIAGWIVGIGAGVWLVLLANHFHTLTTSIYPTPLGPLFIGIIALTLNIIVAVAGSWIVNVLGARREGVIREAELLIEEESLLKRGAHPQGRR